VADVSNSCLAAAVSSCKVVETTAEIGAVNTSDEFVERAFYAFENRSNRCHIEHLVLRFAKLRDRPDPQNLREYRCPRKPLSLAVPAQSPALPA
jgi:hypothetical protein